MSLQVAVILPTIVGREDELERVASALHSTSPHASVYVEHDHPSCGAAWLVGAARAYTDGFDYIALLADDLEPLAGWVEAGQETVDKGFIPAPLVYQPHGPLESAGLTGFSLNVNVTADWQLVEGTTVPFLSREMWEAIGMIDVHYCSDLYVSFVGRRHGWETVIRTSMGFVHHHAMAGRNEERAQTDTVRYLDYIARLEPEG